MSKYSHKGYEQRTGGYGRRRHKASGFQKKKAGGALNAAAVLIAAAAVTALLYLFADNIAPFVNSIKELFGKATDDVPAAVMTETTDLALSDDVPESREKAQGYYDRVDGGVFISNGAGYMKFKGIDTTAKNYSAVLNSISSSWTSSVKIYSAVIPTNTEFGLDGALEGSNDQRQNLDVMRASLSDNVNFTDIYSALDAHRGEYLYYRTDECMTSLGGYYAYREIARNMSFDEKTVYSLSALAEKKGSISPFHGSFVSRTTDKLDQPHGNQELFEHYDTIEFYKLPVHYNCYSADPKTGSRKETDLFDELSAAADPLKIFPGKDTPLLQIENTSQSAPKDKLLIVKDHDAEPVTGYLIPHFGEVFVADVMLYSGNLREYANENGVTHVLFINGIDDANNSLYCQRMRDLFDNSISDQ